jgi:hypothetical protein
MPYKFGILKGKDFEPFKYGNIYWIEETPSYRRLCIGSDDPLEVIFNLAETLSGPFYILYVLHTPRSGNEAARYQSPKLSLETARGFFHEFGEFFQKDARHDVWLHSQGDDSTIVYDRHDLIYAYGLLDNFIKILRDSGFREKEVKIPVPHCHNYYPEYDRYENSVVKDFAWAKSPLREEDEQ